MTGLVLKKTKLGASLSSWVESYKTRVVIVIYTVLLRNNLTLRSRSERVPNAFQWLSERCQNARSSFGSKSASDIVIYRFKPTAKQTARLDRRCAGRQWYITISLLNEIKRETKHDENTVFRRTSDSPDHSFLNFKANCHVDSSLVKLSFAKITRVLCLHAKMCPMLK